MLSNEPLPSTQPLIPSFSDFNAVFPLLSPTMNRPTAKLSTCWNSIHPPTSPYTQVSEACGGCAAAFRLRTMLFIASITETKARRRKKQRRPEQESRRSWTRVLARFLSNHGMFSRLCTAAWLKRTRFRRMAPIRSPVLCPCSNAAALELNYSNSR